MRIGIAYDLVPVDRPDDGPDDRFEEFDKPETIEALAEVLRREGHVVSLLGDGREFLTKVLDSPPDLVWNLAEGEGSGRARESRVPAALEMLGIPYTGSDPLTLALALDKQMTKRLVRSEQVAVPRGFAAPSDWTPAKVGQVLHDSGFWDDCASWILKPAFEGSSKGIRAHSVTGDRAEAIALFGRLAADYRQPILIEEFIDGDEVTVGMVGNGDRAEVIGTMRVRPKVATGRFVYSLELKRDWSETVEYEIPARLDADAMGRLIGAARSVYETLGCRDVARIDFRVRDGIPYFIEANPLPGLAPGWSDLVILAEGMGLGYGDLIRRILDAAVSRHAAGGAT